MQRDDWYSTIAMPADLADAEGSATYAARRALARLGARKIATCEVPVLFEAPLAAGLIGAFVHAVSGGSLYRKSSFLLDSLGKQVFSPQVQISERPHLPRPGPAAPSTTTAWPRATARWSRTAC
jgi:PmbA protein